MKKYWYAVVICCCAVLLILGVKAGTAEPDMQTQFYKEQLSRSLETKDVIAEYNGDPIYVWEVQSERARQEYFKDSVGDGIRTARTPMEAIECVALTRAMEQEAVRLGVGVTEERAQEIQLAAENELALIKRMVEMTDEELAKESISAERRVYAENEIKFMAETGLSEASWIYLHAALEIGFINGSALSGPLSEMLADPLYVSDDPEINRLLAIHRQMNEVPADQLSVEIGIKCTNAFLEACQIYEEKYYKELYDPSKLVVHEEMLVYIK